MAVLGYNTIGGTHGGASSNIAVIAQYTAGSAGSIPTVYAYSGGDGGSPGTVTWRSVIFDSSLNLLAYGAEVTITQGDSVTWRPSVLPGNLAIANGASPWIGFFFSGPANVASNWYDAAPAGTTKYQSTSYTPAQPFGALPPDPFVQSGVLSFRFSCYADFGSFGPAVPWNFETAPSLSGAPAVGGTLTAANGKWTNTPTGYVYQWQHDNSGAGTFSNILGATAQSYAVSTGDAGCIVRCAVTGVNADGTGTVAYTGNPALIASTVTPNGFFGLI